jgi:hypothetical protein
MIYRIIIVNIVFKFSFIIYFLFNSFLKHYIHFQIIFLFIFYKKVNFFMILLHKLSFYYIILIIII